MKRGIKFSILLFAFALAANCSYNWGQFNRYAVVAPANLEVVGSGERVVGRDCGFSPSRWYSNSIAEAVRDALIAAPGSTGLKDVDVKARSYHYFFLSCVEVEGTPVKEVVAEKKTNKKK
ncbi:hypothetical protein EHQ52_17180 [Leptospira koniambonensis]|uniref:Lipoprotein n=1 Tax=Leptospira koniambonensis TaxID=2484950 RepID=A0A4R9J2F5_9LEPT|nr:hypothetical protein [Leptospira koniambonensis]TGL29711.1 hypothetical protein EHQ52_17180 [Leptospira koniambonensis]